MSSRRRREARFTQRIIDFDHGVLDLSVVQKALRDRNIRVVYGATLLLGVAYGVSIALTSLHLDALQFGKRQIGSLAGIFALGIVVLSLPAGALIRRYSARRVLLVSLLGYATSVSLFPFLTTFLPVAMARFCDGACSVGVWVSSETILLSRSDRDNKANVMSLYAIAMALGYILGPLAARAIVAVAPMRLAFLASGALALAALGLVFLRLSLDDTNSKEEPSPQNTPQGAPPALSGADTPTPCSESTTWQILGRIKTACFATFSYGYFQASVVLFLPLFLVESRGIPREQTIVIPAFFAAGMLLFSNYASRWGDRHGHLVTMRALALVGLVMVASFAWITSFALMALAVFVAGATLASISPLSLALQGVVVDPTDYSRANALYNAFYAAGMLLGPPLSSVIFDARGGAFMLAHLAALWVGFVLFATTFLRDDPGTRLEVASEALVPMVASE